MHELKALLQMEATKGSQCVIVAEVSASDVLRKFELLAWCNHHHHKDHHHHKLIRGNKSNTTPSNLSDFQITRSGLKNEV